MTAPRIFCIPATRAPVAAVLARGQRPVRRRPERWTLPEPAEGDPGPLHSRFGFELRRAETFAIERERGWTETEDTPARDPHDMWDEKPARRVTMRKRRPGADDVALIVGGRFAAFRDNRNYDPEVWYALEREDTLETLEGVQWADWDGSGRTLVATTDGRL